MSIRIRTPDTVTLQISHGDWLRVKKHLTAGEQRAIFKRMMRDGVTGDQIDSVRVGWSKIIGYLLDWSFQNADGTPLVILDKSDDEIGQALDAITVDAFRDTLKAIEAHEDAMTKALEAEQSRPTTEIASSAIS